jgi:membrane protein DedA with SNARE-associated domain/membrane-associated phospholipid phosphatase
MNPRPAWLAVIEGCHNPQMQNGGLDHIVAWIGAHPVAAGALIFLVAFCDSLIVVGIVVPALPLLFAIGTLIGLGHIDGPYALACAAAGAFVGDGLSYWIGHRWGPSLRQHWPFSRYPQLIDRGERLFRRHGSKGIVIARFVGAVRPFVPAVAGMLRMPLKRYIPASAFAAFSWAGVFLAPGWIFGASYDAVAAVADRLALVLLALGAVLALIWAIVLYTYRWFAGHADRLLARALKWTRAHPRLGRYAASLIQPHRPESASLAMLAVCLLAIGWGWFGLMATVLAQGGPLAIDYTVHTTMQALRNPLADRLLAAVASLGDAQVLAPPLLLAMAWLLWRKRYGAAAHWLAAICFGLLFTTFMGLAVEMPQPPGANTGYSFPAISITLFTIAFGFFAVLIARELPGRQRVWPYMVAGVGVALLGFARLYFSAHWLSDVVGGVLFGIAWLLAIGIAYRRHSKRSFWMRPLAMVFYIGFAVAAIWHAPRAVDPLLARLAPSPPTEVYSVGSWWDEDWASLPTHHDQKDDYRREIGKLWPLDVQVAGSLEALQARLQADGWRTQPQANWIGVLGLLDPNRPSSRQPVLPAALEATGEILLMRKHGASADQLLVLRLWPAPATLDDGTPLWIGTTQVLRYKRPLHVFGLWTPQPNDDATHQALKASLHGLTMVDARHPKYGVSVLRIRSDRAASANIE